MFRRFVMTDIIVEDKKGKDIKYLPQFKLFHKFLNAYLSGICKLCVHLQSNITTSRIITASHVQYPEFNTKLSGLPRKRIARKNEQ